MQRPRRVRTGGTIMEQQTWGPKHPLPMSPENEREPGHFQPPSRAKRKPGRPPGSGPTGRQGPSKTAIAQHEADREFLRSLNNGTALEPPHPDSERYCEAERTDPKAKGMKCRNPAGKNTEHEGWGWCHLHGGNTPTGIRNADIQKAAAEEYWNRLDTSKLQVHNAVNQLYQLAKQITPEDALEQELWRCQGAIEQLQVMMADVTDLADLEKTPAGRVLRSLYEGERSRITKVAKTMLEIDLKDRQTTASEALAGVIVSAVTNIIGSLRLDPEQAALVGPAIREHLELLAATEEGTYVDEAKSPQGLDTHRTSPAVEHAPA